MIVVKTVQGGGNPLDYSQVDQKNKVQVPSIVRITGESASRESPKFNSGRQIDEVLKEESKAERLEESKRGPKSQIKITKVADGAFMAD